jgi:hypothetical protein
MVDRWQCVIQGPGINWEIGGPRPHRTAGGQGACARHPEKSEGGPVPSGMMWKRAGGASPQLTKKYVHQKVLDQ